MIPSVLLSLVVASAAAPQLAQPGPEREIVELELEIEGTTIRALCTDGPREVVLLHGGSSLAETWRPVLARLDGSIGACAYDRRGNGRSFPGPEPRGWYELLDELRRIHDALGFEGRYVLVGHSLGGLYGRLFAIERPRDVAALLLVDPSHEDMLDRIRPGMPDEEWRRMAAIQREPNEDGVVESQLAGRLRRGRLPDIPVTVLTAAIRPDADGWDARFLDEAARQVHASVLQGITIGRHVPASQSGHNVQEDQPGLVANEITRLVRATRAEAARRTSRR